MTITGIADRVCAAKADAAEAEALIRDYLPFIKAQVYKTTGKTAEDNGDELSVAMLAFHEAVGSYGRLRGGFLSYAAVAIRRRLIDYHRREKRHNNALDLNLSDDIADGTDSYDELNTRDATRQEIAELSAELKSFGLSLSDIADSCPRQERTLKSCQRALKYARENPELIAGFKRSKRLPLAELVAGAGVERKTLERHRKYIMALLLIYSNGYEIIRGHLKQVQRPGKGGEVA